MNECWLIICFILCLIIALGLALYPLRKQRFLVITLLPFILVAVAAAYSHWGAWLGWEDHLQQALKEKQVKAILQKINGPQELIAKLKAKLATEPDSARDLFLLGKLYASQNEWQQAHDVFKKAYQLQGDDEQIIVNYAQSIWQLNHQQFNTDIRVLFQKLLQKNQNQPDALAMLAMDAFMSHDYQQAINYWQRLLTLAHPQSDDAKAIRKAIAKAHSLSKKV